MNGKMLLLFAASLVAYGQTPVVRSAIVNSTTNQITIAGSSLLPTSGSPVVYLDGELLTLVSSSSTQIVATMPVLPAGSFRLVVGSEVFDVTNGAVGPAGPAGATGATGPAGPAGPQGPSGPLTLPFSGTASDTTTCVFCITNTAPQHAAIAGQGGQALSGANSGGTGVGAYGGTSNGTSILVGKGGSGVYAVGGAAAAVSDEGGLGLNAYGGNSKSTGGSGVQATGGSSVFSAGGDGIDAYGGGGSDGGTGIYAAGGTGSGGAGDAGYFSGNVEVVGSVSKSSGSFKIDHPLDPANKYLYHSFVESPDMKNIYDGNVTTDGSGAAIVTMPSWFEALNTDFRYQLTTLGQPAHAWIGAKIANGNFTIRTDKPHVEVSWQVTGIRQDAWANAHRVQVEVDKAKDDQGHFIHPELFGHEGEPSIAETRHPRPPAPEQ
jgi:IPT/TIG domain